jgi:hypothetical protein
MIHKDTIKHQKNIQKFVCEFCDFRCSKKGDWDRHILTSKHINKVNLIQNDTTKNIKNIENTETNENNENTHEYLCDCGNKYKHHSGLWRHKTKGICVFTKEEFYEKEKIYQPTDKDLIMMLIKENSELKTMMMEQQNMMMKVIENGTTHNSHNTNNSHNKAFNLQFFLNETCKDAMNIMDFVESIKLQVSDLESVGELGYVEGISNIIVKNLNALDVTQRPVHCTDKKRETIYIKDDNKWEKDEEQKKMHKMIKKVADKNARLLPKFTEKYPDYKNYHSKTSDKYSKIIIEAMGGSGDNDYEKEEKIIKNIAKNILVEKGS